MRIQCEKWSASPSTLSIAAVYKSASFTGMVENILLSEVEVTFSSIDQYVY